MKKARPGMPGIPAGMSRHVEQACKAAPAYFAAAASFTRFSTVGCSGIGSARSSSRGGFFP
jgi:hypothetical protein